MRAWSAPLMLGLFIGLGCGGETSQAAPDAAPGVDDPDAAPMADGPDAVPIISFRSFRTQGSCSACRKPPPPPTGGQPPKRCGTDMTRVFVFPPVVRRCGDPRGVPMPPYVGPAGTREAMQQRGADLRRLSNRQEVLDRRLPVCACERRESSLVVSRTAPLIRSWRGSGASCTGQRHQFRMAGRSMWPIRPSLRHPTAPSQVEGERTGKGSSIAPGRRRTESSSASSP